MDLNKIEALDKEYFMPVFGKRLPVQITRGKGAVLYDSNNKSYTDFLSGIGVCALGYNNKAYNQALKNQIDKIVHLSNYFYGEQQSLLAQQLCNKTGYDKVFFTNSGGEAMECAIKLAKKRAYQKDIKDPHFISLKQSFHGRTLATLSATGQPRFHAPFKPSVYSYSYVEKNNLPAVEQAIQKNTVAIIVEPILGEGGVHPLTAEYLHFVRDICTKKDILLILDEVQTGVGRTGKFLAQQHIPIQGDICTLAKGLGGGLPIGACLAVDAAVSFEAGDHGSTFAGNPLCCAAGLAVLKQMDDAFLNRVNQTGSYFKAALQKLMAKHKDAISHVRGSGLMLGAQLKEPLLAADVQKNLLQEGFIIGTAGDNTLRFLPPLIVSTSQIDGLIASLDALFTKETQSG